MPTPAVPHLSGPGHVPGFGPAPAQNHNQVSVSDNADRPDQGPPPSANWHTDPEGYGAGGFTVTSNQFVPQAGFVDHEMSWVSDLFGPNLTAQFDLPVLPDALLMLWATTVQVAARFTGYQLQYNATTPALNIVRNDDGGGGIISSTGITLLAGDTIQLRITPTAVEGWRQSGGVWSLVVSAADTTYRVSNFLVGIYVQNTVARLDNFKATSQPSVTTLLALSATSTPTTLFANQAAKLVTASETATAATQRRAAKTLAVSETATAALPRQAGKLLAAAETGIAAVTRRVGKTLTATEAAVSAIQKQIGKLAAATETATATLGRIKTALLLLAASSAATSTVQKQDGKQLGATETASTSTSRRTGKTGVISETATATIRSLVGKLLVATETATATLTRIKSVQLLLAVTNTAATTLRKQTGKAVAASGSATTLVRRSTSRLLVASCTGAASVAKLAAKTLPAAGTAAVGLVTALISISVHALRAFYGYVTGVGDGGQPPQTGDTGVISWTTTTGLYPSPDSYPSPTTYPQPTALIVEAPSAAAVAATGDTAIVSVGASGGVSL